MADVRWNTDEITKYINSSGLTTKIEIEAILNELKVSQVVMGFLDTVEGKLVMASVLESIRNNVRKIHRLSVEGFDKNFEEIRQASMQVHVSHDFMLGILSMLSRGEDYEKAMIKE